MNIDNEINHVKKLESEEVPLLHLPSIFELPGAPIFQKDIDRLTLYWKEERRPPELLKTILSHTTWLRDDMITQSITDMIPVVKERIGDKQLIVCTGLRGESGSRILQVPGVRTLIEGIHPIILTDFPNQQRNVWDQLPHARNPYYWFVEDWVIGGAHIAELKQQLETVLAHRFRIDNNFLATVAAISSDAIHLAQRFGMDVMAKYKINMVKDIFSPKQIQMLLKYYGPWLTERDVLTVQETTIPDNFFGGLRHSGLRGYDETYEIDRDGNAVYLADYDGIRDEVNPVRGNSNITLKFRNNKGLVFI